MSVNWLLRSDGWSSSRTRFWWRHQTGGRTEDGAMTWALVALQLVNGVILVLAFIASRTSRRGIWPLLILLAIAGIFLFGALASFDPLLPYY